MLDLIKAKLVEKIDTHRKERDELLKIAGLPLVRSADEQPAYSPAVLKAMAYVDAFTQALNFMEFTPAEMSDEMSDEEKWKLMLEKFLGEVNFLDVKPSLTLEDGTPLSPQIYEEVKNQVTSVPFSANSFPVLLLFWYREKFNPATPRFDQQGDGNEPPEPEAA